MIRASSPALMTTEIPGQGPLIPGSALQLFGRRAARDDHKPLTIHALRDRDQHQASQHVPQKCSTTKLAGLMHTLLDVVRGPTCTTPTPARHPFYPDGMRPVLDAMLMTHCTDEETVIFRGPTGALKCLKIAFDLICMFRICVSTLSAVIEC